MLWSSWFHTSGRPSGCRAARRRGRPYDRTAGRRIARLVRRRTVRPFGLCHGLARLPAGLFRLRGACRSSFLSARSPTCRGASGSPSEPPPASTATPTEAPAPAPAKAPAEPTERSAPDWRVRRAAVGHTVPVGRHWLSVWRHAVGRDESRTPAGSDPIHEAGNRIARAISRRAARHWAESKRSCSVTCWHRNHFLSSFSERFCLLSRLCDVFPGRRGAVIGKLHHAEAHAAPCQWALSERPCPVESWHSRRPLYACPDGRPRRFRRRKRRRQPQQPGIKNAPSVNCPFMKAARTSSTRPQVKGRTCTPADASAASNGSEIAPQISTSAPNWATCLARRRGSVAVSDPSLRRSSCPSATSTRSRLPATSNTGDTRPFHCGIATFINRPSSTPVPDVGGACRKPNRLRKKALRPWSKRCQLA